MTYSIKQFTIQLHSTYHEHQKICRVVLYSELFYVIIPTLFSLFFFCMCVCVCSFVCLFVFVFFFLLCYDSPASSLIHNDFFSLVHS